MPAKPLWFSRLESIIADLEALPDPFVDRLIVERLFEVGARRAQQIIAPCVARTVGTSSLADRNRLVDHLRRIASGDIARYERQRRKRLAGILESERRHRKEHPQVLVAAPTSIVNQEFGQLPDGIELRPGEIRLTFAEPQEALQKLLALAMAIGNDQKRFEQLTARS